MTTSSSTNAVKIAVLRCDKGLFELVVGAGGEEEQLLPLDPRAELVGAWNRLGAVREIHEDVVRDVRLVLAGSVLDTTGDRPALPTLEVEAKPAAHRATAANPRAYRGTKDRPPKPRRPKYMDLRPFLCTAGGQDRLVSLLEAELGPIELPPEVRDLPPNFQRYFGWLLRDEQVAPEFYWQLGLDVDEEFRRQVATLFSSQTSSKALTWCRLLASLGSEVRSTTLSFMQAYDADCRELTEDEMQSVIEALGFLSLTQQHYGARLIFVASALANGHKPEDIAGGLGLALEFSDSWSPEPDLLPAPAEDVQHVRGFVKAHSAQAKQAETPRHTYITMRIWESCAYLPGLGVLLASPAWEGIQDDVAWDYAAAIAELARPLGESGGHKLTSSQWLELRPDLALFLKTLAAVEPDYQVKALSYFEEAVWQESANEVVPELERFVLRTCRKPFAKGDHIDSAVERLCMASEETIVSVLKAPDSSFLALESATKRRNDSFPVALGLDTLRYWAPELICSSFASDAKALFRTAHAMGRLSRVVRKQLVLDLLASPLAVKVAPQSGKELTARYDMHGPATGTSPIPKRFRSYLAGELDLRPGQVERHEHRIRSAWDSVLLAALHEAVTARSQLGLSSSVIRPEDLSDSMQHALVFQLNAADNRRSLRRLIRACLDGDADYLTRHPANRAWYSQHPKLDAEVWRQGPTLTGVVEGHGEVTLTVEGDPLEALRLGTYVGSCLGLGGSHMHSAAAVVLDANKQVVFARDKTGAFVARQVLAITDGDELACFAVYPSSKADMLKLFRDYDFDFAKQLGLSVERIEEGRDEAEIALPLSTDWWHDGLWDFDCEVQEAKGTSRAEL